MSPDADDPAVRELTIAQAAAAAHVPEARIRGWSARHLIEPVNPGEPHPRYLELDVLKAEAKTRRALREQQLEAEADAYFGQAA